MERCDESQHVVNKEKALEALQRLAEGSEQPEPLAVEFEALGERKIR